MKRLDLNPINKTKRSSTTLVSECLREKASEREREREEGREKEKDRERGDKEIDGEAMVGERRVEELYSYIQTRRVVDDTIILYHIRYTV